MLLFLEAFTKKIRYYEALERKKEEEEAEIFRQVDISDGIYENAWYGSCCTEE